MNIRKCLVRGLERYIVIILVCFCASVTGSVCGIGGGVIIKPVLDAIGVIPVHTVSFLSGCTVLSMAAVSVLHSPSRVKEQFNRRIAVWLGLGSAAGGLLGKAFYQGIIGRLANTDSVGAVQAGVLLVITVGTLIYTLKKNCIGTLSITHSAACFLIGLGLGILSSFLGIGGGPVNLVVLFFFFSMRTKQAAVYSLFIIMMSQTTSLISSMANRTIPEFPPVLLATMIGCGIVGGMAGSRINKRIKEAAADKLFIGVTAVIIMINIYNVFKYIRI